MGGSLPLGYDPPKDPLKARVLEINPDEAKTVQALFALYLKTGTLNATRYAALAAGLSPRKADHSPEARAAAAPPVPFSYGQLHYLLTNPVYSGLIRHKALVHPGQHAPIIHAATWEAVQAKLQDGAARKRQKRAACLPATAKQEDMTEQSKPGLEPVAPLATKLFDETGDRLTPSHTNRHNRRFRYYVSRRLITTGRDPSGWRLPAPQLEALVLAALRAHPVAQERPCHADLGVGRGTRRAPAIRAPPLGGAVIAARQGLEGLPRQHAAGRHARGDGGDGIVHPVRGHQRSPREKPANPATGSGRVVPAMARSMVRMRPSRSSAEP